MSPPSDQAETRTTYGYTFKVTKDHLSDEQLHQLKYTYDELGSKALDKLDEVCPPPPRATWAAKHQSSNVIKTDAVPDRDMYALLRDHHRGSEVLEQLWDQVNTVPDWVDWAQIKRGQEVFYRYAPPMLATFALKSLIGTTGSSYRPAETLVRTGGHSAKIVKNRFFETFQLILQVNKGLEDLKPGGDAFAAIIRVRMLHSSVRNRILKLTSQRPSYYDKETFGVPINDLDSIQSLCAFTTDLVYLGLPRQGIFASGQEIADLIAVWRWVGYVLGTPYEVLQTPEKAHAVMESIMCDARKPTKNSRVLVGNALEALDGVSPIFASKSYWAAGGYWLNGPELCREIGIQKPGLYYTALIAGQCWLFIISSYLSRVSDSFDRWKIESFRKVMWNYLVESKEGLGEESRFEFKYVPEDGQKTGAESMGEGFRRVYGGVETIAWYGLVSAIVSLILVSAIGVAGTVKVVNLAKNSLLASVALPVSM